MLIVNIIIMHNIIYHLHGISSHPHHLFYLHLLSCILYVLVTNVL